MLNSVVTACLAVLAASLPEGARQDWSPEGDATCLVQQQAHSTRPSLDRPLVEEEEGLASHANAACPNPVALRYGRGCRCTATSCGELPDPKQLLSGKKALIVTSWKDGKYLDPEVVDCTTKSPANKAMNMDMEVEKTGQKILGFGGAITDATAFHFHRLQPAVQHQFLQRHYGKNGAGYSLARVPMGASDFSRMDYTLDNVSGDLGLKYFCLRDDSAAEVPCGADHKATVLKAAQQIVQEADSKLKLFVSPWSPPLWYKNQNFKCHMKDGLYICNPARMEARPTKSEAVLDPLACTGNGPLEDCPTAAVQEIGPASKDDSRHSRPALLKELLKRAAVKASSHPRHRKIMENVLRDKPNFTPERPDVTKNMFNRGFLTLNSTLQASWAMYFSKFIDAYKALGVDVWGLTVQNEPSFSVALWQGTNLSPKMQADFLMNHLGPTIRRNHPGVKIMVHDDGLTGLPEVAKMLSDPRVAEFVDGVGYHWYLSLEGTYENSQKMRPAQVAKNLVGGGAYVRDISRRLNEQGGDDKFILMTEACNGFALGTKWMGPRPGEWGYGYSYSHDIMWQLLNGAAGWTDWNIMLGQDGGPNVAGNFADSTAVFESSEAFIQNPSFFHLAHFSKYVLPGSRRVTVNIDCGLKETEHCQAVGFMRPDGLAAVVLTNDEVSVGPIMDLKGLLRAFVKVPKLAMGHGRDFNWTLRCGPQVVTGSAPWRSIQTVVMPCT